MHIGGRLIREFDAFLHLLRSASAVMHAQLVVPSADQFELNKVLAGLGGPPAAERARIFLDSPQSLAALCLYLAMHEEHCPVGVFHPTPMARVKQLVHVVAHAMVPMVAGGQPMALEAVRADLADSGIRLCPVIRYGDDGSVASLLRSGGQNAIGTDPDVGPYKVAINPPDHLALDGTGVWRPVAVHATWRDSALPMLRF